MKPNRPLIVILSTVALDAVGIGLIMPVLPGLLRDLVHSNDVTAHYGILLALYALMQFACAPVLAALWVIFGEDRFHWDATTIGISLAAFGILHSLAQAMITGPVAARLGERRALMLGMIADGTGYILLAFATRGWMAFPIMVLLASGGIGMPALQAMLSRQVDEERQGQLQGSLAALTSLTSIVGPLLFTAIYAASITTWNGWAWIAGAALYLLCLPALRRGLWRNSSNSRCT
ncbi:MFS transporter [Citrobacter freundii]